jgi:hypothetical protein
MMMTVEKKSGVESIDHAHKRLEPTMRAFFAVVDASRWCMRDEHVECPTVTHPVDDQFENEYLRAEPHLRFGVLVSAGWSVTYRTLQSGDMEFVMLQRTDFPVNVNPPARGFEDSSIVQTLGGIVIPVHKKRITCGRLGDQILHIGIRQVAAPQEYVDRLKLIQETWPIE